MKPSWKKTSSSIRNSPYFDSDPYDTESPYSDQQFRNQSTSSNAVIDASYVETLRKRFHSQQTERSSVKNNEKLGCDARDIHQRLREHSHPCDLSTLTCLVSCCGRTFERIQVLAFHVSYAHQDLMTSDSSDLTCLLCGKKWTTVRRKIMHLSLAHREIGEEHNSQCMLQVESVIAPNAPKAQRLEKARMIYGDGSISQDNDVYLDTGDVLEDYVYNR
ncbi:unnamed protein product [Caenorhabditis brenneri]